MKNFLDTNVLVSAIATRGLCADLLREVLARHELIISRELLQELEKVLQGKIALPRALISEFITFLQQGARLSEASKREDWPIRDQDDIPLLSAALNGETDLFITGDRELIGLQKIGKMEIVSPRTYWDKLTRLPPDS
jgi:uncharacterized protein